MPAMAGQRHLPNWLVAPVFATQGLWVRHRTPRLPAASGPQRGVCGAGPLVRLLALGDSIIAGVGVGSTLDALPAKVAALLAAEMACRVEWEAHGENGARTHDLLTWLNRGHHASPDLILVSNGLNDLTSLLGLEEFLAVKGRFYEKLAARFPDCRIVQLGLPPLAHFPALPRPLRGIMGQRAGAYDRALAALTGEWPRVSHFPFSSVPAADMFASDGYHPNEQGIGLWAAAIARHVAGMDGAAGACGTRDA